MTRDQRLVAASMLRGVLEEVAAGRVEARSAQARRLVRRLEGALLALEVGLGGTEPKPAAR